MPKTLRTIAIILILLATAGYLLFQLYASGFRLFNNWENLGSPSEKIKELIGIEIGSDEGGKIYRGRETKIYVLTSIGKVYSCCEEQNVAWKEPVFNHSNEEIFADCVNLGIAQNFTFPDEVSRRTAIWCGEFDGGSVTYVLHSDGTVSYRREFSKQFLFGFSLCFFAPVGVTLSIIILLILDKILWVIRRRYSVTTN